MTSNTDDDRRKDCLRNFVLHLSERGDLAPLVEAPYGGLEDEIGSILENRALAVSGTLILIVTLLNNFQHTTRATSIYSSPFTSPKKTFAKQPVPCTYMHPNWRMKMTG